MADRRRFNTAERVGLFLASGGRCALCGVDLPPRWHGDHISPYRDGGRTDVLNGQATCPPCNLKKGARTTVMRNGIGQWPANRQMRPWQERAFRDFTQSTLRDYLIVATPGAGKTIAASKIAYELLLEGSIDRIAIVVPTDHLQRQWADAAASIGINLTPGHRNGDGIAADVHGVVVTYAAVASSPMFHRALCSRPTLVIFDEVHHAGEGLRWGTGLREAFDPAAYRLMLSGTPFRSDNNPIPFVRYDDAGRSVADFTYDYGQALANNECRPVLFPSFEGRIEWLSAGEVKSATFEDKLAREDSSRRLRTALDPRGEWLKTVLAEAHGQLMVLRETGHDRAGGLVIAIDQQHARAIAELLYTLSGRLPAIALSDDPDASRHISVFAAGLEPWLVAVRMVSEGVDIPRLRVGVYATNVQTELFFRQAVGRFVRCQAELEEQSAYVYIPKDETLVMFAQQIKEERDHQLEQQLERVRQEIADLDPCGCHPRPTDFAQMISTQAEKSDVFFDQQVFTQGAIREAAEFKARHGVPSYVPDVLLADILRKHSAEIGTAAVVEPPTAGVQPSETPAYQRKKQLRTIAQRKVSQLSVLSGQEYRDINARIKKLLNVPAPAESSEAQLLERIRLLDEWIGRSEDAR